MADDLPVGLDHPATPEGGRLRFVRTRPDRLAGLEPMRVDGKDEPRGRLGVCLPERTDHASILAAGGPRRRVGQADAPRSSCANASPAIVAAGVGELGPGLRRRILARRGLLANGSEREPNWPLPSYSHRRNATSAAVLTYSRWSQSRSSGALSPCGQL